MSDQSKVEADWPPISTAAADLLGVPERPTDFQLAAAFAALGGLPPPTRPETARLLYNVTRAAFKAMPGADIPWEPGEYFHSAEYPVELLDDDDLALAICTAELGLLRVRPERWGESWAPRNALFDNLRSALAVPLSALVHGLMEVGAIPSWTGERRPPA